jgi:putative sterol carrier protein
MSATFASQEWADSLGAHLLDSASVRTDSITWVYGPLLLVVDADAEHGLEATAIRIDLHEGSVRGVELIDHDDVVRAPFAIGGSLARWKAVFGGELKIVDAILESKLRARGDLPTLVRHRTLLDGIATAGASLTTKWQDEQEPAAAPAG